MDVKTLIVELEKVKNKDLPVFIYIADIENINSEIMPIEMVDDSMNDRIDLNMGA